MLNIKRYIVTNCISFTLVIIFYTLIDMLGLGWKLNNEIVLKLFAITSCTSVLQFFTDKLTEKNPPANIMLRLLDVFFTVFIVGGILLKVFTINTLNTMVISAMIILVFVLVHCVMLIKGQVDATAINKKLEQMRLNNNKTEYKHE